MNKFDPRATSLLNTGGVQSFNLSLMFPGEKQDSKKANSDPFGTEGELEFSDE